MMRRRELLKFMYGFGGVSLSQLLRARAAADDVVAEPGAGRRTLKTAMVNAPRLFLCGNGVDPSSRYVGPQTGRTNGTGWWTLSRLTVFKVVSTNYFHLCLSVPINSRCCEVLPTPAAGILPDRCKCWLVIPTRRIKPACPSDWMSIANYLRHNPKREIQNYVTVNPVDRYDAFTLPVLPI